MNLRVLCVSHPRALSTLTMMGLATISLSAVAGVPASPITARNCSEQTIALAYPSALYRKLLPPGFSFPAPSEVALMEVSGTTCDSIGDDGPSTALLAFMEVTPPAGYADPNIGLYAIALDSYSASPAFVAAFAGAGFGGSVHPGTVKVKVVDHPLLRERNGTAVGGDTNGEVMITTTVFGPLETIPAARTRLFAVRDGAVVGIADGTYNAHHGYIGIGTLLKFGDSTQVLPATASIATHETGFELTIEGVPLSKP